MIYFNPLYYPTSNYKIKAYLTGNVRCAAVSFPLGLRNENLLIHGLTITSVL